MYSRSHRVGVCATILKVLSTTALHKSQWYIGQGDITVSCLDAYSIFKAAIDKFFLAVFPTADTNIDLYYAVPVGGSVVLQCGISQGALGGLYSPEWTHNRFQPVDVHTPGSRFTINQAFKKDFSLTISFVTLNDNGTYVCGVTVNNEHFVESPVIELIVYGELLFTPHTSTRVKNSIVPSIPTIVPSINSLSICSIKYMSLHRPNAGHPIKRALLTD